MEFEKFKELEEKIKNLINEHSLLKKSNQELEELLRNKEVELGETSVKIGKLNEEREDVRAKVDSLLDLLQDIDVLQ